MSILGNSPDIDLQLLAPFHAIIGKSRSSLVATRKVSWLCYTMRRFDECAKKCPHTRSKSLKMAIVQQWNTICDASKNEPKAFNEFIGCERHHFEITSSKCTPMKITLQTPLKAFCEQLHKYAQCYMQVPFKCSINGTEIWKQIKRSIRKSYGILLDLSAQHLNIPQDCKWSMSSAIDYDDTRTITPMTTTERIKPSTRLFIGWQPEFQRKASTSAMDDYWVDLEETSTWPSTTQDGYWTRDFRKDQKESQKNSIELIEWHEFDERIRNEPQLHITTTSLPTTRRLAEKTKDFIKSTVINPRQKPSDHQADTLNRSSRNLLKLSTLLFLLMLLIL
uniref:Uncharacterized protein n=1 Tax=Acrobeloides nanus TaxID=290746 RepID=A0A914E0N2_9BILA